MDCLYRVDQADDAFFGRGGKLMAVGQMEQALKFELLVPVRSAEQPTACMSFNYHRDRFGRQRGICTTRPARCRAPPAAYAFGMDRLALALFATHGLEAASWPEAPRKAPGL